MDSCFDIVMKWTQLYPHAQANFAKLSRAGATHSEENLSRAGAQITVATRATPDATLAPAATRSATGRAAAPRTPRARIIGCTSSKAPTGATATTSATPASAGTHAANRAKASLNITNSCINNRASHDPSATLRATPASKSSSAAPSPLAGAGCGAGNAVPLKFMLCSYRPAQKKAIKKSSRRAIVSGEGKTDLFEVSVR
jgi:hypothetical protein